MVEDDVLFTKRTRYIMMKNLTARAVTIHQGVKVATMSAANVVPHMLAPEEVKAKPPLKNPKNDIIISMKGASQRKDREVALLKEVHKGGPSSRLVNRAPSKNEKPELDRTPLEGEQLEKLYQLNKLAEGTVDWTEEQ